MTAKFQNGWHANFASDVGYLKVSKKEAKKKEKLSLVKLVSESKSKTLATIIQDGSTRRLALPITASTNPIDDKSTTPTYNDYRKSEKDPNLRKTIYSTGIRKGDINSRFYEIVQRIGRAEASKDYEVLENNQRTLVNGVMNLIIFDIQATGIPILNTDGTIDYPSIFQISLYNPLTESHYTSYVTPHKPIAYDIGHLSGVYNSFELEFDLPHLNPKCEDNDMENLSWDRYVNVSFLDRPEIREMAEKLMEETSGESKISPESALDSAVDHFIATADYPLVSLDHLNRSAYDVNENPTRAPLFSEIIDDILEFIGAGEFNGTSTFLMSYNGHHWGEPILKGEMERYCSTSKIQQLVFLDSIDLFRNIFSGTRLSVETFSRSLGRNAPNAYDSSDNAISLWKNAKYLFGEVFSDKSITSIYTKIAEEIYRVRRQ